MVIKDGRVLSTMTISDDGKMQTIEGTFTKADGTTSYFDVKWKKVSGGSGLAGTWEQVDIKFTDEWEIEPYQGDALTFNTQAEQDKLSMKFDGKDYEEMGPNVPPGSTLSGKA
jgi:hypothetical protein